MKNHQEPTQKTSKTWRFITTKNIKSPLSWGFERDFEVQGRVVRGTGCMFFNPSHGATSCGFLIDSNHQQEEEQKEEQRRNRRKEKRYQVEGRNNRNQNNHNYIWCRVAGPWDPPPREGGRVTTPRPPLWYCGTSRVSWQSSRQQNMFQINNKYTTPAPPCGTVVLLECRGKQVDSRTCSK